MGVGIRYFISLSGVQPAIFLALEDTEAWAWSWLCHSGKRKAKVINLSLIFRQYPGLVRIKFDCKWQKFQINKIFKNMQLYFLWKDEKQVVQCCYDISLCGGLGSSFLLCLGGVGFCFFVYFRSLPCLVLIPKVILFSEMIQEDLSSNSPFNQHKEKGIREAYSPHTASVPLCGSCTLRWTDHRHMTTAS